MVVYKIDHIVPKGIPISWLYCLANNSKCARVGTKVPASKGYDFLHTSELLKALKFIRDATNVNFKIGRDVSKGKVNMRICLGINLIGVHVKTLAVGIPRAKVADANGLFGRAGLNDVATTVLNT